MGSPVYCVAIEVASPAEDHIVAGFGSEGAALQFAQELGPCDDVERLLICLFPEDPHEPLLVLRWFEVPYAGAPWEGLIERPIKAH